MPEVVPQSSTTREDWFRRDLRILEIVAQTEDVNASALKMAGVAIELGLDQADVIRGMEALADGAYVTWHKRGRNSEGQIFFLPKLRERGRRELRRWPANGFDALVAALEQRISLEKEPAARSRLEKLLTEMKDIGRDVLTDVLTAVIKSSASLP